MNTSNMWRRRDAHGITQKEGGRKGDVDGWGGRGTKPRIRDRAKGRPQHKQHHSLSIALTIDNGFDIGSLASKHYSLIYKRALTTAPIILL